MKLIRVSIIVLLLMTVIMPYVVATGDVPVDEISVMDEKLIVGLLVKSLGTDKQVSYIDADVLYNNNIKIWIYPKIADENNTFDIMTKTCLAYIELRELFPGIRDLLIEVDIPLSDRPHTSLGTANCSYEWTYGTKNADGTWNVDSVVKLMEKVGGTGRRRAYDPIMSNTKTEENIVKTETKCTFNIYFPNIGHINPTGYYMGPYSTGSMGVSIKVFGDMIPTAEESFVWVDNATKFLVDITDSREVPYIAIREGFSTGFDPASKMHGVILVRRIYKDGDGSRGDSALNVTGMIDALKTKASQDGYTCEVSNNESSLIILKCTNHSIEPDIWYFVKQVDLMYDQLCEYGYLKLDRFDQDEADITLSTLIINETTYDIHECHTTTPTQLPKNEDINVKKELYALLLPNWTDQYIEILSRVLNASEEEYTGYQDTGYIENTVLKYKLLDDPRTVDLLIHALKNNPDLGGSYLYDILDTLTNIGTPAVGPLIQVLLDGNIEPTRRSLAVEALGEIADPRAIYPLIQNLKRDDCDVDAVVVALTRIGDAAIEPLISTLKDEDPTLRENAAFVLGYIGDARSVDALRELLNDSDSNLRNTAERSLRLIDAGTIPA